MLSRSLIFLTFTACLTSHCVFAQTQRGDLGEFAGFFGPTMGGIGSNISVGGGSYVQLGSATLLGIEGIFTSMGDRSFRPETFVVRGSRLYDINATLHIQSPREFKRFKPYGLLSIGLQHASFETRTTEEPNVIYVRDSTDNFGFATGGGARYYMSDSWGFRPEVRVCISARTYVRLSIGVFAEITAGEWMMSRRFGSWLNPFR